MVVYKTRNQPKFKIYVKPTAKHYLHSKSEYYKSDKETYTVLKFYGRLKLVEKDETKINTIKVCRKNFIKGGYDIGDINIDAHICRTINIPCHSRKTRNI